MTHYKTPPQAAMQNGDDANCAFRWSAVIPAYNEESDLAAAVDFIRKQTVGAAAQLSRRSAGSGAMTVCDVQALQASQVFAQRRFSPRRRFNLVVLCGTPTARRAQHFYMVRQAGAL